MLKTKSFLYLISSLCCYTMISSTSLAQNSELDMNLAAPLGRLVFDESLDRQIPRNFRTHVSTFVRSHDESSQPTRVGLENIKFAASAQFSEASLKAVLPQMQGPIWMIDLRLESHGFVNGLPISWYTSKNQSNYDLTIEQIETLEKNSLQKLDKSSVTIDEIIKKESGMILETKPHTLNVKQVETERELVKRLGLHYIRLPIADHRRPTDTDVDDFIKLIRTLPEDTWLYFHCRAGKGRTTTFVALWDMLTNANQVSLDDIMSRQHLLGGAYLTKISSKPENAWKAEWAKERRAFLAQFYQYAQQADYRKVLWSQWLKSNAQ